MTNTELGQTLALLLHVWETHGQEVCEELMHRALTEEEMAAVLVHMEVEDHLLWRECA